MYLSIACFNSQSVFCTTFLLKVPLQPFAKRLALPNSESKQINVNPSLGLCHFSKLKAAGNLFGRFIAYKRPQSVPWKRFLTKRLVGSSLSVWRWLSRLNLGFPFDNCCSLDIQRYIGAQNCLVIVTIVYLTNIRYFL